jgi:hypothetical protein
MANLLEEGELLAQMIDSLNIFLNLFKIITFIKNYHNQKMKVIINCLKNKDLEFNHKNFKKNKI